MGYLPQRYTFFPLLPQNIKSVVLVQLDDGRAFGFAEAVVVELHHIIHRVFDFIADVAENHRRRLTGQVGRCRGDGLTEATNDFLAELVVNHADADALVVGNGLGQVLAFGIDDAQRTFGTLDEVVGDDRHANHIILKPFRRIDEDDEAFVQWSLLDGVNPQAGLVVGGVAAHTPDGVGRVEDGLSGFQRRYRAFYFLFKYVSFASENRESACEIGIYFNLQG